MDETYNQDYFIFNDVLNRNKIKFNYQNFKKEKNKLHFNNGCSLLIRYIENNIIREHPLLIKKNNNEYDAYGNRIFLILYHFVNSIPYMGDYLYYLDKDENYYFYYLDEKIERIYKKKNVKYREMKPKERINILEMKIYYNLIYDVPDEE